MRQVFQVNIIGWEEHNPKHKKGMSKFMFSSGFFSDQKMAQLKPIEILLFIKLLCIACDMGDASIQISAGSLPKSMRMGDAKLTHVLSRLEQIQLVTVEKQPLIKEINKETKETNKLRKGNKNKDASRLVAVAPAQELKTNNVIAFYCDQWKERYRSSTSPIFQDKDLGNLKRLVAKSGAEKIMSMIEAYFKMPDSWFLTKSHDIPTFLGNLNKITHFMETGKMLTRKDIKNVESKVHTQNLLDMIDEGKI